MSDITFGFDGSNVMTEDWNDFYRTVPGVVRGFAQSLAVTAPGGLLAVTVGTGRAEILGGRYGRVTPQTHPIEPNTSGSTRTDLVVLRFRVEDGTIGPVVIKGTPAGGLIVPDPSITPLVWDIPLALVTVLDDAAEILSENILDFRSYKPPRFNTVDTQETTANGAYTDLATVGPRVEAVYLGPSAMAKVTINAKITQGRIGVSIRSLSDVQILAPDNVHCIENATAGALRVSGTFYLQATSPPVEGYYRFMLKYLTTGALGTFQDRTLIVEPVL